jgi:hypothetical protein
MRMVVGSVVAGLLAATAVPAVATSPPREPVVAEPGPVTITVESGGFGVGGLELDLPTCLGGFCPSFDVDLQPDGRFEIPLDWLQLPPITLPIPIGEGEPVEAEIGLRPDGNGRGVIDPTTGEMSLYVGVVLSVRARFALPGFPIAVPIDCDFEPLALDLTTGTRGALTGEPYDPTTGAATLVDGLLGVGGIAPTNIFCILAAGFVNPQLGLPLPPGTATASLSVRVSPAPQAPLPWSGFDDVPYGVFFDTPVRWLVVHGLTTGYGNPSRFAPSVAATRAQLAALLHRMMGAPAVEAPCGFHDVPAGSYFEPGACWLKAAGLTTGWGGDTSRFRPGDVLTRGQLAAFLWRWAGSEEGAGAPSFLDVPPGAFFASAVGWMAQHGITTGWGGSVTEFRPGAAVTRAQLAAFLYRLVKTPGAWTPEPPAEVAALAP